jgi:hypothetical protein
VTGHVPFRHDPHPSAPRKRYKVNERFWGVYRFAHADDWWAEGVWVPAFRVHVTDPSVVSVHVTDPSVVSVHVTDPSVVSVHVTDPSVVSACLVDNISEQCDGQVLC